MAEFAMANKAWQYSCQPTLVGSTTVVELAQTVRFSDSSQTDLIR